MTGKERKEYLKKFKLFYSEHNSEKQDSQKFWLSLLKILFDLDNPEEFITFEDTVKLDKKSFIDGYIESTHTLIEQKSASIDLNKKIKQSDGTSLTPYEQAKRYNNAQKYSKKARWIVTCNFKTFHIYDMENLESNPIEINLEDIDNKNVWHKFDFLIDKNATDATIDLYFKEKQLSEEAGLLIQKLYSLLEKQYSNIDNELSKRSLNILCVRLVFLFYADSAEIFDIDLLKNYLTEFKYINWHRALKELFNVLDTSYNERSEYDIELNKFPYVNGGLFQDKGIEIPTFTRDIANLILNECMSFNWSDISPTIFGGIFEATMNPDVRRKDGMHYTSVENIHKVIDPLFLNELYNDLDQIKHERQLSKGDKNKIQEMIEKLHSKISNMVFLDPACGSGNFLTETFICLRRIENELILFDTTSGQYSLMKESPVRVSIDKFYGIEINDFAVSVAKTALWIAELQMMKITQDILPDYKFNYLPLHTNAFIVKENALKLDWENVVSKNKLSFIIGNPPFKGTKTKDNLKANDIKSVFKDWKNYGTLDYVCCWFKKAADMIIGTNIKCAFVATNSICQGEQVYNLWNKLLDNGIEIQFAHKSFIWENDTVNSAKVHCIIIGFSNKNNSDKYLYTTYTMTKVSKINPYLVEADNILVTSRKTPLCDVPSFYMGCELVDGDYYVFTEEEKNKLIKDHPEVKKYLRPYMTGKDFIDRKPRYCLWFVGADIQEISKSKYLLDRVNSVKNFRLSVDSPDTRKHAQNSLIPVRLRYYSTERSCNALVIPKVSSGNRKYIPMDIIDSNTIAGGKLFLMPNAELFYLSLLESRVHMCWVNLLCGRLKSDYSYSNTIVYNTFPFPELTARQKNILNKNAQDILDIRAKYTGSTLATLYNDMLMPSDLRDAHTKNDNYVLKLYGLKANATDEDILSELFKRYKMLCG